MGQHHWWDEWITAIVAFFATDLGHFLGGLVLLALGWLSRNVPIRSGLTEVRLILATQARTIEQQGATIEALRGDIIQMRIEQTQRNSERDSQIKTIIERLPTPPGPRHRRWTDER